MAFIVGIFSLTVYGFGIPFVALILLYKNRKLINEI